MVAASELTLLCSTLIALFAVCAGSSTCYVSNSYYASCEHGCCGTFPYEECCDNLTALIVGLVVGGLVIVCIVVAVVCFVVQHQKSNQVVRMVQSSAHSRGDTANITILHMSSNNPYERAPQPPPPPHGMMTTTTAGLNQPCLPPPDVPYQGFHPPGHAQAHPAPGQVFSTPASKHPTDPAFPPAGGRPPVNGSSGISGMAPPPSMMNGPPGMVGGGGGGSGLAPPPTAPSLNGGPALFRGPTMNGAPGGFMPSSNLLPKISGTPRKVPPLPALPVPGIAAGGASSPPETPPDAPRGPVITAFGEAKGNKGGGRAQRERTNLGGTTDGGAATTSAGFNSMGVEDIEEVY